MALACPPMRSKRNLLPIAKHVNDLSAVLVPRAHQMAWLPETVARLIFASIVSVAAGVAAAKIFARIWRRA